MPRASSLGLRWYVAYGGLFLAIASLPLGIAAGLWLTGTQSGLAEILLLVGGLLAAMAIVMPAAMARVLSQQIRTALARLPAEQGPPLFVAPAYFEVAGRYQRRPPGLLLLSSERLIFLASKPQDAPHDRSWLWAEIEGIRQADDRFGVLSTVFDLQGSLEVRFEGGQAVFSVVGRGQFARAFARIRTSNA